MAKVLKKEVPVDRELAKNILGLIDQGLVSGIGKPIPGQMCVEAAVCYAMGLPHSDEPPCVHPVLRRLKIRLNDSNWSSNEARAKGMRRLAIAQLGTKEDFDSVEFMKRVSLMLIQKIVPRALRHAASCHPDQKHKDALEAAAVKCETSGDLKASARAADAAAYASADAAAAGGDAARAAAYAADAAAAGADAADAADAARAGAYAALAAARAGAYAALAAAYAADAGADAAYASADAADAAAYAAYAAAARAGAAYAAYAAAADADARDKELAFFAEEVVKILIDMKAKGTEWLDLTEAA